MRKRALLAIVFAGGILNSGAPAFSQVAKSNGTLVEQIVSNTEARPEIRAFYLLKVANSYADGASNESVSQRFGHGGPNPVKITNYLRRPENVLSEWAYNLAAYKSNPSNTSQQSKEQADLAAIEAVKLLEKSSNTDFKSNLYFIASCLFQKTGNTAELKKCDKVIMEFFQKSEKGSPPDEKAVTAVAAILNYRAYELVPIRIYDEAPNKNNRSVQPSKKFTADDVHEAEKLKVQAVTLADRLSADAHERRKVHRDLSLWYTAVGNMEAAEKEKQILFELVGQRGDSLLQPRSGSCGSLVWWNPPPSNIEGMCGRG